MPESIPSNEQTETPARPGMVDWYAPIQLIQTGGGILLSTLLGSMIDSRRFQALEGSEDDSIIDYSDQDSFTFDYMADTGDGWASTYSMAYLLTSPEIEVEGLPDTLSRADAVVLGGDEVYPVASKELYAERLVSPFNQAPRDIRRRLGVRRLPRKDIYLIPGNHDWYDSLGSFSRRFFAIRTRGELRTRKLGQFNTRQVRGYFVLKLPSDWEIWALDIQLTRDFDNQQFDFFDQHADSIAAKTKVILCLAEPEIVYGKSVEHEKKDLIFGLKRISRLAYNKGARVLVQLAGDVHNYQRYEVADETKDKTPYTRQHYVSGGGGAFLHPTHSFHRGTEEVPRVEPKKRYPERETSKKLSHRNLLFAALHPGMSALLGALYLLAFWREGPAGIDPIALPIDRPGTFLLILVILLGCAAFAGFGKLKTTVWGLLHGAGHVALAVLSWHLGAKLGSLVPVSTDWLATFLPASLASSVAALVSTYLPRACTFVIGGALGGTLFGIYLWCSLNLLRIHHNEGFSSICSPDYKNFLRCSVREDGSLRIRSLGVERTAGETEEHPVKVHLIEEITIPSEA